MKILLSDIISNYVHHITVNIFPVTLEDHNYWLYCETLMSSLIL